MLGQLVEVACEDVADSAFSSSLSGETLWRFQSCGWEGEEGENAGGDRFPFASSMSDSCSYCCSVVVDV